MRVRKRAVGASTMPPAVHDAHGIVGARHDRFASRACSHGTTGATLRE